MSDSPSPPVDAHSIRLAARRGLGRLDARMALGQRRAAGGLLGSDDAMGGQQEAVEPQGDGSRLSRAIIALDHQHTALVGQALRLEEIVSALAGRLPEPAQAVPRVRPAQPPKLGMVEDLIVDHDETLARIRRAIDALADAVG